MYHPLKRLAFHSNIPKAKLRLVYPMLIQVSSGTTIQDVVISCPTSYPPYTILALYKYISECVPCSCRVHVHSSATSTVSDELRGFFNNTSSTNKPQLVITLVWKSGMYV